MYSKKSACANTIRNYFIRDDWRFRTTFELRHTASLLAYIKALACSLYYCLQYIAIFFYRRVNIRIMETDAYLVSIDRKLLAAVPTGCRGHVLIQPQVQVVDV